MGKLKTRIKGPGSKAKRWPKGQSSSSNPTTNKHRDAAKGAFFQPFQLYSKPSNEEKGGLTEEMLMQHTYTTTSQSGAQPEIITAPPSIINGDFGDDETASMRSGVTFRSGTTFKTFASGFTDCSNMSFNKLFRSFTPRSALHKEMLAVLAAVTEVIKQQGGQEKETEYFAALMTTLEVPEITEDALGATVALLGMVIKKVPASVLKAKFSASAKRFLDLLVSHLDSDNALLIRSLIGCLGVLLRNQDAGAWTFSSTLQIYDALLTFVTSPKPQVRKAAQHAISVVLKASPFLTAPDAPVHHPAASRTGKYCATFIEEHGFGSDTSSVLHLLNLLKEIMAVLPQSEVKPLCESLLKLMTLNNVLITSCAMQCLYGLMICRPRPGTLSAELNAKLITALYDYQPSMNDSQPSRAWLSVMTQSLINLSLLDLALCTGHLPRFFSVAAQLWSSDRMDVVHAVTPALSSVTSQCLEPALKDPNTSAKSAAEKMIRIVEQSLNYQTVKAWKYIIHLSTVLIEAVGKTHPDLLKELMKALTSLRVSPNFPYETEVDYAIGKLSRVCGPKFLLQCIPLGITGKEKDSYDFPYSWLLPILRENIQNTQLGFFIEYFLPLAQTCRTRVNNQDRVASRVYDLIQRQIWALLPGFCKFPTDVDTAFKQIAKLLGQCLTDRPDIRMDVMAALRQLIIHSKSDEKIKNEISRFAKNYIPILFNLYTTKATTDEEESQRASVYETINFFLQVAEKELLYSLFDKAKDKLEATIPGLKDEDKAKAEANLFLWDAVLALLRSLVVYQNPDRIEGFVQMCLPWMTGNDQKAQKKAYKIVEEIVEADEATECGQHVRKNLNMVVKLFTQSREAVKPTSRASRLRSLNVIVNLLSEQEGSKANRRFVTLSVTEALAGVKGIGDKLRTAAYKLIITAGQVFQKWNSKTGLKEYVSLLMRGTSSKKEEEVMAAITAVTYVVYEFASNCTDDIIDSVLEQVLNLMVSDQREVVLSCLIFVRMFIVTVHSQRLPLYLKRLMDALCNMEEELRRVFLIKTRDILIRLMRKCGPEVVIKLVPEEDEGMLKRLNNIRKIEARKKKKREEEKATEKDAEEEDVDSEIKATQPKTMEHVLADSESELEEDEHEDDDVRKKTPKTWIKEDEEDNVIDLLDPSAAQKVTATNPLHLRDTLQAEKKKKRETLFKTAADGRLIIDDGAVSSDSSEEISDDDLSEALDKLEVGKKRKHHMDDEEEDEPSFKYQAGGIGIHRPIAEPARKESKPVKKLTSKERAKMGKESEKVEDFGAEYRSTKARGDIKRKGKPDPFAYVPLTRTALNKRKQAKMKGQFKGLVKAARKGAAMGAKIKAKANK